MQGNRTFGINQRPDKQFLDRLAEVCHIDPPREHGLGVVDTTKAMHDGRVKALVSLGGNLALASPDTQYMFEALQNCDLTVQVSTKLNRSHIVHGRQALILPCAEDYDRIRDTAAQVPDGFEDFNARVRRPHGFRISQPARERGFLTPFGRADFGLGPLPDDIDPGQGWLSEQRTRNVHRAGPRDGAAHQGGQHDE